MRDPYNNQKQPSRASPSSPISTATTSPLKPSKLTSKSITWINSSASATRFREVHSLPPQSSVNQLNQKTAPRNAGLFFCQLVRHGDVASLRSFGSLFDCELDLLTFLQVAETIALNGGEMDKNVLAAFALDEAEALRSIEPLDCTGNSFRHCICLLWQKKRFLGVLSVPSEDKTKQPTESNRELWLFFKPT